MDDEIQAARLWLEINLELGADEALCEEPQDRFAPPRPPPPARAAPMAEAIIVARDVVPHGEAAAEAAQVQAAAALSLSDLKAALERFDACPLKATAANLVFEDGTRGAPVMIVDQVPDREEDLAGKPLAGRPGALLNRMLAAIGLDRSAVYVAPLLPWRPPGGRAPTALESRICRPFLERQIVLADPKMLLLLGGAAAKELIDSSESLPRLRGRWRIVRAGGRDIPALTILHPAYLLRQPLQKKLAWSDMLTLKRALDAAHR